MVAIGRDIWFDVRFVVKVHQYIALLAMLPPDLEMWLVDNDETAIYETLCRVDEPQMVVVHKGVDGDMYPLPPHHTVSAPQLVVRVT